MHGQARACARVGLTSVPSYATFARGRHKQPSPMITALTKLLLFQLLGEALAFVLAAPIPGPVIGMVLLFAYLLARGERESGLVGFSSRCLQHLSLLFIPAAVGVMAHLDLLAREWIAISVALTASMLVAIVVTAYVTRGPVDDD